MDHTELQKALLAAFREEAPDLISQIRSALLDLESADDAHLKAAIDQLKRPVHSLKGAASAIGRDTVRDLCHLIEDQLVALSGRPASALLDGCHQAVAYFEQTLEGEENSRQAAAITDQLAAAAGSEADQPRWQAGGVIDLKAETAPASSRPAEPVGKTAAATQDAPTATQDAPVMAPSQPAQAATIRVAVDKIEHLHAIISEVVSIRLRQEGNNKNLTRIRNQAAQAERSWQSFSYELRALRNNLSGRDAYRFDTRMSDMTAALRDIKRALFRLTADMNQHNGQLNVLADAMDDGIRSVRMMPLAPFLESFRMTAREAGRTLNKPVQLTSQCEGVDIDRLVMDKLREPLTHLVRNAISHGIESPEQRRAAGKPEQGQLTLHAQMEGEHIHITLADDGAGMDTAAIQRKAIGLGWLSDTDTLTDDTLLELICKPGFSTQDDANVMAGRGVGMDVVAAMVTELGGQLQLATRAGEGTRFALRLPASLSTAHGLVVAVGDRHFGIVLDHVERIERCALSSLQQVDGKWIMYLAEHPVSVTSLAQLLGLPQSAPAQNNRPYPIVVLRSGSQRLAVVVDDIPGEVPVVVKPLGPQFRHLTLFAGGSIQADGSVLPVVDTRVLITRAGAAPGMPLADTPPPPAAQVVNHAPDAADTGSARHTILVVDDSITTRTLERNILEAAGFAVSVATDGLEALDILSLEEGIAMVVTDMEMPRMDGIELCKQIRAGRHAHLPIIMVTSVGNEEEKQKGLDAGADAYIIKGNFQQDHFLGTVNRFLHV